MENQNQNLAELERASYLSKENSRLYEAYYEEERKVNDLGRENEKLKKRIDELEKTEQRTPFKGTEKEALVIEISSDKEDGDGEENASLGVLIANQRKSSDELMEAPRLLIKRLEDLPMPSDIGVKLMGEVDCNPLVEAMKKKGVKDVKYEAMEKCSLWNKHIRDPHWYPFKVIEDKGKTYKEIIDNNDEKLNELKKEMGGEVYKADEHNPKLWNFKEGRKASFKEAISFVLDGSTTSASEKRRRGRNCDNLSDAIVLYTGAVPKHFLESRQRGWQRHRLTAGV